MSIKINKDDKYGLLTILKEVNRKIVGHEKVRSFLCKCDCGNEKEITLNHLRRGSTKSCGCLKAKNNKEMFTTHDLSYHELYQTWNGMIDRCEDPNADSYKHYGARGIKVCDEWKDIRTFINDMYPSFQKGLTIDRIDSDGDYCKQNCKWSTYKEQANNTKKNVWLEYNGEKHTIAQWSEIVNMNPETFKSRIRNGWTIEDAIKTPVKVLIQRYREY